MFVRHILFLKTLCLQLRRKWHSLLVFLENPLLEPISRCGSYIPKSHSYSLKCCHIPFLYMHLGKLQNQLHRTWVFQKSLLFEPRYRVLAREAWQSQNRLFLYAFSRGDRGCVWIPRTAYRAPGFSRSQKS